MILLLYFLQVYEARLFRLNKGKRGEVITSAEEAVDLQKKKSALNRFYTTLARTDKNSGSATAEYEDFGKKRDLEDIMVRNDNIMLMPKRMIVFALAIAAAFALLPFCQVLI